MRRIRTFYDELGIGRDATAAAIKHAFKEVAKVYHPDKNPPHKQAWAHEQMSRLNFIVQTLLDPRSRAEYDGIVRQYEQGTERRPQRTPHEQYVIEREYARVSVEIMNLRGKYANCRLKMAIGTGVTGLAILILLMASFTTLGAYVSSFQLAFARFLVLVGAVMSIIGFSDFLGRGQFRRRIDELEQRRSELRRRVFEVWTAY